MTLSEVDSAAVSALLYMDEYASRVSMHHTDAAGVVYIGHPIQWAQVGLENLFRAAGHPVEELGQANVHYPMVRQVIDHHRRLSLGDLLVVRTFVTAVGNRSFTTTTQIAKPGGEVHVTVGLTGVAVSRDGSKPIAEQWLRDLRSEAARHGLTADRTKEDPS
ncbi:acyl-CoA thioesterase [Actinomadura macra]|uniref:acyl-CoA thioesterase n=1 Tax=Actinomadura macra TaxID=46164 RepID=UPI000837561D|nr:thioesterase family protein [Actinomadura macra]